MGASSGLMATSVASQGISSAGNAYSQAQAMRSQGAYQKQMMDTNARLAGLQAEDAIRRGENAANAQSKKTKQAVGSQRVALAAQGISVDSGSALDAQIDTTSAGEMDALTIRNNAWREAWGYRTQALDYSAQGAFGEMAAKNQARNTLLTGGMQFFSKGLEAGYYAKGNGSTSEVGSTAVGSARAGSYATNRWDR